MGRIVGWTLGVVVALAISVAPAAAQSWSVGVHVGGGGYYGPAYYPPVYRAPVYAAPVYRDPYYDGYYDPSQLAMKGDLAVVELIGSPRAFRLDATGWQPAGSLPLTTEDIEIDGGRAVLSAGDCSWSAIAFEPDGAGGWTRAGMSGQSSGSCDDENWGGPVDITGDRVIIGNGGSNDLEDQEVRIYQRSTPTTWNLAGTIVSPEGRRGISGEVALRGDDAIVNAVLGAYVYRYPNLQQVVSRIQQKCR